MRHGLSGIVQHRRTRGTEPAVLLRIGDVCLKAVLRMLHCLVVLGIYDIPRTGGAARLRLVSVDYVYARHGL